MLFLSLLLLLFCEQIENEPLYMTKLNATCITVFGYRGFELCDENYRVLELVSEFCPCHAIGSTHLNVAAAKQLIHFDDDDDFGGLTTLGRTGNMAEQEQKPPEIGGCLPAKCPTHPCPNAQPIFWIFVGAGATLAVLSVIGMAFYLIHLCRRRRRRRPIPTPPLPSPQAIEMATFGGGHPLFLQPALADHIPRPPPPIPQQQENEEPVYDVIAAN